MPDRIAKFLVRVIRLPAFAAVSRTAAPGPLESAGLTRWLVTTLLVALCLSLPATSPAVEDRSPADLASSAGSNTWRFRVWLDDKPIGFHRFRLVENGDVSELHSEAEFEYKLLFVTLYDYRHENRESWKGNCLQTIESSTDANGEPYSVSGRLQAGEFELTSSTGRRTLPSCVMSFAYWNPAFLQQDYLINTQDGEFLEVEVSAPMPEQKEVRGELLPSYRYRLQAGPIRLDLWYSTDNEWLALESEARGGRTLRYELL